MELLWYSQLPCFDVVNVTTKMNEEFGNLIVQYTFLKSSLHSNLALELKEYPRQKITDKNKIFLFWDHPNFVNISRYDQEVFLEGNET